MTKNTIWCFLSCSFFAAGVCGGGAGGAPENQLAMEQQAADGDPVQQAVQGIIAALADLQPVLPDGGQGRRSMGAERQVVKPHDAQLAGHINAQLVTADQDGMGQQVGTAQDGRHPQIQKPGQMDIQTLGKIIGVPGQLAGTGQPAAAQLIEKAPVPHLGDMGPQGPAQIADFPVSHPVQGLHRLADGLIVVDAQGGHGGVPLDEVVVEDRCMAGFDQTHCRMRADEARAACQKNFH